MRLLAVGLSALALAILAGCSSSSSASSDLVDTGTTTPCAPFDAGPSGDGASLGVTRAQVDTIVNFSCAIASCHGRAPGSGHLFMPKAQSTDAGAGLNGDWYDQVVNVASTTNPSMKLVVPGDPANSWLVHKVGGDQCEFASSCVAHNCGERMPQANAALDPQDVETIVEWVREGAPRQ